MANIGTVDRVVRFVIGVVLILAPFFVASEAGPFAAFAGFGWLVMLVGLVAVLTAAIRFCPMYRILGVCTCKTSKSSDDHSSKTPAA